MVSLEHSSQRYEFTKLLSENVFAQSWSAVRRDTARRCFVKCASAATDLTADEKSELLRKSFDLQSRIKTPHIHTASGCYREDGQVFVEYPFLDPERLAMLSPEVLLTLSPDRLIELAVTIDYLHELGLIHCDLKLDNFRVYTGNVAQRLVLIDLDTIQKSGEPAHHRIIGTPGFIAPELLKNDRGTAASDLYHFGCSIRENLKSVYPDQNLPEDRKQTLGKFDLLVSRLTDDTAAHRPEFLLGAMRDVNLFDEDSHQVGLKRLLSMLLLTRYRCLFPARTAPSFNLQRQLFNQVGLYSLPDELSEDLQAALVSSPRTTIETMKRLISDSHCFRWGEFWHLRISDDQLTEAFDSLSGPDPAPKVSPSTPGTPGLKQYLSDRRRLSQAAGGRMPTVVELRAQAELAVSLNRPMEASEYLKRAADAAGTDSSEYLHLLLSWVQQSIAAMDFATAGQVIEQGLARSMQPGDKALALDFRRLRAWLLSHQGNYAEADELFREISLEAHSLGLAVVQAKTLGDWAGSLTWEGRVAEAWTVYEQCFHLAESSGIQSQVAVTYYSCSMLAVRTGEYIKAVALAKMATHFLDPNRQSHLLPLTCLTIATCHCRLGNYRKTNHWFGKCLSHVHRSSNHFAYSIYYSSLGWSQAVSGHLEDAKISIRRAISCAEAGTAIADVLQCLGNLAEIALYQGNSAECSRFVAEARAELERRSDSSVAAELNLIEQLNAFFYGGDRDLESILGSIEELIANGCRYYASLALLVVLVEADTEWRLRQIPTLTPLMERLSGDRTPVHRALEYLASTLSENTPSAECLIDATRNAYKPLESAGHWFLALLACRKIAQLYIECGRPRIGARFLRQAGSLAARLSNAHFVSTFDRMSQEYLQVSDERRLLVRSFEGVADVLSDIESESDPLDRLLNFAVDAVEAERGVLLLYNRDNDDLTVRAYVGCDAAGLGDVISYSRSIPRSTLASSSPVFVADALADRNTNRFKSIVAHNIRSVISVPIVVQGETRGVIYLDHHTIPALFDEDDLTYVKALSKFLSLSFDAVVKSSSRKHRVAYLEGGLAELGANAEFITQNESLLGLLAQLPQVAASNMGVLVRGESGTGKELVCRLLHSLSARRDGPFVKLNCAAVTSSLVESELFGVADRTATGVRGRPGKFESADGGTLFLDEIGDMPLSIQAKVLRVLEYQEFERVGSNKTVHTDVRFVYATNQDLRTMVGRNEFREDLYYRVAGVELVIPPLRERPDDIALLCRHFCKLFGQTAKGPIRISSGAMNVLESYHWPGNVRELRNILERLSMLRPGRTIEASDLPDDMVQAAQTREPSSQAAQAIEKARIIQVLDRHGWNQSAAARALDLPLSTFRRKLARYSISRH